MGKAHKGTVQVCVDKGYLRLRWSYSGKRYALTLGVPDSKLNRSVAETRARIIQDDIVTRNFDFSLKKYKTETALKRDMLTVVQLFRLFTTEKAKSVYHRTLEKYEATIHYLEEWFKDKPAESVNIETAEQFILWLGERNKGRVLKERVGLLKACWDWAIRKQLITIESTVPIELNPWSEVIKQIKIQPKQRPKPFTREETGAIIQAFRTDKYYSHYADYVEFLFGTGCRTGEAIGLRWKHLTDNCSTVWIGETISRGVRKSTKTNKDRFVSLTPKLQAMLLGRRPTRPNPDALVFTAPKGNAIDDHNFRNRAWKTVLTRLEIDYRKPYNTRHTLISHALDLGENPAMIAQLTGHDVKRIYEDYAGNVKSRPRLPEL